MTPHRTIRYETIRLPVESIVESGDAAIPILVEICLDRVLQQLGEHAVAHVSRFARLALIDLDRNIVVGAILVRSLSLSLSLSLSRSLDSLDSRQPAAGGSESY